MTKISSYKVGLSGNFGRVRCEPGWRLEPAWSENLQDFDLWLVWAGKGRMKLRDREIELVPGTCVWMRPGGTYAAEQSSLDRLGVSFCHFTLEGGADFAPPFEATIVRSLDFAQWTMAEVVRWRETQPALAGRLLGGLLEVLSTDAEEKAFDPVWGNLGRRGRHHRLMRSIAAKIEEEPGQPWSVTALARESGWAPDHFSRVFRDVIGQRPQAYVLRTRISRARQLLEETKLGVGEVAHALGFRDAFYFSRQFRRHCGVSPSTYRRLGGVVLADTD